MNIRKPTSEEEESELEMSRKEELSILVAVANTPMVEFLATMLLNPQGTINDDADDEDDDDENSEIGVKVDIAMVDSIGPIAAWYLERVDDEYMKVVKQEDIGVEEEAYLSEEEESASQMSREEELSMLEAEAKTPMVELLANILHNELLRVDSGNNQSNPPFSSSLSASPRRERALRPCRSEKSKIAYLDQVSKQVPYVNPLKCPI